MKNITEKFIIPKKISFTEIIKHTEITWVLLHIHSS